MAEANGRGKIKEMTEEDLDGFDLNKIACRSCSGYGNCGYKTYGILNGKVVSICNQRLRELRRKRELGLEDESENKSENNSETADVTDDPNRLNENKELSASEHPTPQIPTVSPKS